ncbi:GNAT family N-acetyltransferase [uncultured Roseovarius sp.]|uniref:GNAT family N-acetyltransferase n=1 Tax=uncultured Roseovarius sp. TaxID=293344 RepID=UPI00260C5C29|nr:GNAT family N-acetyltransferase [uncultured Roseovarius sp.]
MTLPCEMPATGPAAEMVASLQAILPRLTTDRLCLRAPTVTDFAAYADIYLSPRWLHDAPQTRHDAWLDFCEMAAGWLWRGAGILSVELSEDRTLLGFVVLNIEYGDPEMELGWMLTASAEGQGYATEAAKALRNWAADEIGVTQPVSYISHDNNRSAATAEQLGASRDTAAEADLDQLCQVWRHPKAGVH